jgi:hypothetical protein
MSSPADTSTAAALRTQLAAVTAERDAAVSRAVAAEAAAASALRRVSSLERLLARDSSDGGEAAPGSADSDGDGAEAETAQAGVPGAFRTGDAERQFGDAAAEPPAPEGANPFAARFDPAQEVREQYAAAQAVLEQRRANAAADAEARKRELEAEERLARRHAKRSADDDHEDAAAADSDGGDAAPAGAAPGPRRIVKAKRPVAAAPAAAANPFADITIAPPAAQ